MRRLDVLARRPRRDDIGDHCLAFLRQQIFGERERVRAVRTVLHETERRRHHDRAVLDPADVDRLAFALELDRVVFGHRGEVALARGYRFAGRGAIPGHEVVIRRELLDPGGAVHLPHGVEMRERRPRARRVGDRDPPLPLGLVELLPGDRDGLLLDERGVIHRRDPGRAQCHPSRIGVEEAVAIILGYLGRDEPLVEPALLRKIFEPAGVGPVDEIGANPSRLPFRDEPPDRLDRAGAYEFDL